jgi:membrane protease YdiL (CAAX protease family)
MAAATPPSTATAVREARWPYLVGYLAAVVVAEICIAVPGPPAGTGRPLQPIGLGLHILLVSSLMFLSVHLGPRDPALASLLVAATLASLLRVFSLAVPRFPFFADPAVNPTNTLPWLGLVSVPMLLSVVAVAYVQRLRPRDLGLFFHRYREVAVQVGIAMTGIPLGLVEFAILRPKAWIAALVLGSFVAGTAVIVVATGLSEELIFRGILLKRAVEGLGRRSGLLYVTAIFTSLHIYFLNPSDLVFVFAVGLFYGIAVLRTKNLWGVILSHSLANVFLYLVAPFWWPPLA